MEYVIISTGSKGNAVILNGEILIDCGVPYKSIKPYVKDLKLVLLTHSHCDHFKPETIRKLASERPTLRFGCGKWLAQSLIACGVQKWRIDVYPPNIRNRYTNLTHGVQLFAKELSAERTVSCGGEHIQNTASDSKLTGTFHHTAATVARAGKLL